MLKDNIKRTGHAEILCGFNITEVKGKDSLEKVELNLPYKGKRELALDGLFVEIGSVPSSAIAKELGVELNQSQEVMVDAHCATNIKGVFAAGDVTNTVLKQGVTATAQGAIAATSAYKLITGKTVTGAWS